MGIFASLDRQRVTTACGVFLLAFGSGFIMQDILARDDAAQDLAASGDSVRETAVSKIAIPHDPTSEDIALLNQPPVLRHRVDPEGRARVRGDLSISADPCHARLDLESQPAAMIRISARYPCLPNALAKVMHEGLEFEVTTDENGEFVVDLPALRTEGTVTVIADKHAVSSVVDVPDARDFERVALIWSGAQILKMHAFEFGADRSQTGHVWSGASKRPDRAARGAGGFLTVLGNGDGLSAEVYSFPTGVNAAHGVVRLLVEASVTEETCNRVVLAKALQTSVLGISKTDVELQMPGCSATGEIVRLQNLLQDMRLAER